MNNMSNNQEIINKLRAPFASDRIEWRIGSCGEKQDGSVWARCLAYIDNRAAMERLDEVYGPTWSHTEEFKQIGENAVCTVTISIEPPPSEDSTVRLFARSVCGSCAVEANGDIDPFKSAASGAMKRAVVNLGIGRYLYDLPEAWAVIDPNGKYDGKTKQGTRFRWNPPQLPAWAGGGDQSPQTVREAPSAPAPARKPASSVQQSVDEVIDAATKVKPVSAGSVVKGTGVFAGKPAAAPAKPTAASADDPVIPFGNNKGKTISQLGERDLDYWANKWEPRPWEKTGKVSPKDSALKKKAKELWAALKGADQQDAPAEIEIPAYEEPQDDVPF